VSRPNLNCVNSMGKASSGSLVGGVDSRAGVAIVSGFVVGLGCVVAVGTKVVLVSPGGVGEPAPPQATIKNVAIMIAVTKQT